MGGESGPDAPSPGSGGPGTLGDSSVWTAQLRGEQTEATARLAYLVRREPVLIGDLILLEVLQGARDTAHATAIERGLRAFTVVPLLSPDLAPLAAAHYRKLRAMGQTLRKTADLIICTHGLANDNALFLNDRELAVTRHHLG